jgi:hypothetical protein
MGWIAAEIMAKQASNAGWAGASSLETWQFSDEHNNWSYSFVKVRKIKISFGAKR